MSRPDSKRDRDQDQSHDDRQAKRHGSSAAHQSHEAAHYSSSWQSSDDRLVRSGHSSSSYQSYDQAGQHSSSYDQRGQHSGSSYDQRGQHSSSYQPYDQRGQHSSSSYDQRGQHSSSSYDQRGQHSSSYQPYDQRGQHSSSYDQRGHHSSSYQPYDQRGHHSSSSYDQRGHHSSSYDQRGYDSSYQSSDRHQWSDRQGGQYSSYRQHRGSGRGRGGGPREGRVEDEEVLEEQVPQTFLISGYNGLYYGALVALLEKEGWQSRGVGMDEYVSRGGRVGLVYQVPDRLVCDKGLRYDGRAYKVKCYVKSVIDEAGKKRMCDKLQLYEELKSRGEEQWLASSRALSECEELAAGGVYIVKPTGGRTYGGHGNKVVRTTEELQAFKRQLPEQYRGGGIVCEYVDKPWRHDGKKAHFRMYYLVRCGTSDGRVPFAAVLWKRGKINHAAEAYQQDRYDEAAVHDTHMKSTADDYDFPKDMQMPEESELVIEELAGLAGEQQRRKQLSRRLVADMQRAMEPVGRLMERHAVPVPEALFGFEVFGVDFMVSMEARPRVYLLEVNTRVAYGPVGGEKARTPGYSYRDGPWTDKYRRFSSKYFDWLYEHGVRPFVAMGRAVGGLYPAPVDSSRRSYIVSGGTGLEHGPLHELLGGYGFRRQDEPGTVGLLWMEKLADDLAHFDRRMVRVRCGLKSLLHDSKSVVANKETLHARMFERYPDVAAAHMARSWHVDSVPDAVVDAGTVLIVRPIGERASCGRGIRMANDRQSLDAAKQAMRAEGWKSAIASVYIPQPPHQPLLLDGRKFHIRMFFVYWSGPGYQQQQSQQQQFQQVEQQQFQQVEQQVEQQQFQQQQFQQVEQQQSQQVEHQQFQQVEQQQSQQVEHQQFQQVEHQQSQQVEHQQSQQVEHQQFQHQQSQQVEQPQQPQPQPQQPQPQPQQPQPQHLPFGYDLWPRGRIVTALEPYTADDWHNSAVHDTHSTSTTHNMWFPEDMPEPSAAVVVFEQMKRIVDCAAALLHERGVGPYPESRNAFEVFGCDFMITADYRVVLIEINDKVGYRHIAEPPRYTASPLSAHWYPDGVYTFRHFSRDYFNWIFSLVIKPLFFPASVPSPHTCCFAIPKRLLHPSYSDCPNCLD